MAQVELNLFVMALGEVCQDRVVDEKWVMAPSLRVGFQWLDRITRSGVPVVNARAKTLPNLALELASPEMARQGLTYLSGVRAEVLIDRIFAELKNKGEVYLTRLAQTPGLIQSIAGTIRDLRLAGLSLKELDPESFEVADKGGEIRAMLAEFEKLMKAEKLIDYADTPSSSCPRTWPMTCEAWSWPCGRPCPKIRGWFCRWTSPEKSRMSQPTSPCSDS